MWSISEVGKRSGQFWNRQKKWPRFRCTGRNIMLQMYYGLIVSILNYGMAIWAQAPDTQIQRIQTLQNKCLKAVCWKNKNRA